MWTVIAGFDQTTLIPYETLLPTQTLGDPQPKANFDVIDAGAQLGFQIGDEVIIFDEAAPPTYTFNGKAIATIPAHNILQNATNFNGSSWAKSGTLSGIVTIPNAVTISITFANNAVGSGVLAETCPIGHVHPGQTYMLSCYYTLAHDLVNANATLLLDFIDASGNVIGGSSVSTAFATTGSNQAHISIQAVAPASAVQAKVSIGGATTSSPNSGTILAGTPQLEPLWFAGQGVSYPTPDCNYFQVSCAVMPDGTISRACRVFAGYIDDYQWEYQGNTRIWHISCAGPGALLDNGQINAVYTAQYDSAILSSIVSTYFANQISIIAPNTSSPATVQQGVLVDSVSYSDNSLREALNGHSDLSGYSFFMDWYYSLRYNPAYYNAAGFSLTDGVADNVLSFNYYDFLLEVDGTQRKRRVKVVGAKFITPAITDTFSGTGSLKTFPLSQQPYNVTGVAIGGTAQKAGINGVNSFTQGYAVLIDKANQQLIFNTAPVSGTNNVTCTYSYEGPVSVQVLDQNAANTPVAPVYAIPNYDSKVHDTNLTSLAAATTRGLAELSKYSSPKTIITLKANQYTQPGYIIFLTHTLSGISNQPFTVQACDASYLGNGINEYAYTLGAYMPTLVDHIRNANKASNRSTTTANITAPQQIDVVVSEFLAYSDQVRGTVVPNYASGVYGTAKYGAAAYYGTAGVYGTARYNSSAFYS